MDADLKAEILALSAKHHKAAALYKGKGKNVMRVQQGRALSDCQRKVAYTFERGRAMARYMSGKFHATYQHFKCRHCGYWHVGGVFIGVQRSSRPSDSRPLRFFD